MGVPGRGPAQAEALSPFASDSDWQAVTFGGMDPLRWLVRPIRSTDGPAHGQFQALDRQYPREPRHGPKRPTGRPKPDRRSHRKTRRGSCTDVGKRDGAERAAASGVILRPDIPDDALPTSLDWLQQSVSARGGEVVNTNHWGRRRLAYPIRSHLEGNYVVSQIRLDPAEVSALENGLNISEDVLRHLVVRAGE